MGMRAGANDTVKQLGTRVTQRYKRRDRCKNIAATLAQGGPAKPTTWGKTEFVCPSTSRPPKESFDIRTIHGVGDPAAEIWFDRREAGEAEIKSLENRAFDRGAICDVHFFHAIGRARFPFT
jgi:hypothetical protein